MAFVQEGSGAGLKRPATGGTGVPIVAVRESGAVDFGGGVNDRYVPLQVDANGNLKVIGASGTLSTSVTVASGITQQTSGTTTVPTGVAPQIVICVSNTQAATVTPWRSTLDNPTTTGIGVVSIGRGPLTSLNAVAATGAGSSLDYGVTVDEFGIQVTTTGAPATIAVRLEGSLDGTNWFRLTLLAISNGATVTAGDATSTGLFAVSSVPIRYARLNLITLTGGTAPTVTGILSAHG